MNLAGLVFGSSGGEESQHSQASLFNSGSELANSMELFSQPYSVSSHSSVSQHSQNHSTAHHTGIYGMCYLDWQCLHSSRGVLLYNYAMQMHRVVKMIEAYKMCNQKIYQEKSNLRYIHTLDTCASVLL